MATAGPAPALIAVPCRRRSHARIKSHDVHRQHVHRQHVEATGLLETGAAQAGSAATVGAKGAVAICAVPSRRTGWCQAG